MIIHSPHVPYLAWRIGRGRLQTFCLRMGVTYEEYWNKMIRDWNEPTCFWFVFSY